MRTGPLKRDFAGYLTWTTTRPGLFCLTGDRLGRGHCPGTPRAPDRVRGSTTAHRFRIEQKIRQVYYFVCLMWPQGVGGSVSGRAARAVTAAGSRQGNRAERVPCGHATPCGEHSVLNFCVLSGQFWLITTGTFPHSIFKPCPPLESGDSVCT